MSKPGMPARPPPSPARKPLEKKGPPPKGKKTPAPPQGGGQQNEEERPKTKEEKAKERAHRREKALTELVDTETTFSELVGLLIEYYVKPLSDYKLITQEQHNALFPQLEVIKGLSDKFLTELVKRRQDWDPKTSILSDLFEDFIPFFRMYQGYVNNHEKAVNLMHKLNAKQKWVEYTKSVRKDCKNFDLASLLILPIQRIPRYKLLLQEVLKNSNEDHPDYAGLSAALEKVQTVSTQINERMKEFERRETVKQIERKFTTNVELLAPARQFVKTGKMWKVCRNKDRLYQFFLFNDQLLYASSYGNKLNLHQQLPIDSQFSIKWLENNAKYQEINGRAFELISTKKSFVAYCDESAEAKEWFDNICKAVDEQKAKQESGIGSALNHQKTQSEVQAVWQPDSHYDECTMEDCHNKFTLINRRHHCRRCGRLVCASCSKNKLPNAEGVPQRACKQCYFKVNEEVLNQSGGMGGANTGDESDSDSDEFGEETTALHNVPFYVEAEIAVEKLFAQFGHGVGSYVLVPMEQSESEDYKAKLVVYTDRGYEHHLIYLPVKKSGVQFRAQVGKKKKDFTDMDDCVQWIAKKTKSTMVYAIPRSEVIKKNNMGSWEEGGAGGGASSMHEYDKYPRARALFDYEAEVLGDLTLRAGDEIIVLEKDNEGGWWTGRIGNREGLFPSNYAEMIDNKELPNVSRNDEPKDGDILIARFDYNEGGKEELAFHAGDKIILQAKDDTGWWLGKLQKSGVVGWFAPDLVVPQNAVDTDDEKGAPYNNNNNRSNANSTSNGISKKTGKTPAPNGSKTNSNATSPKGGSINSGKPSSPKGGKATSPRGGANKSGNTSASSPSTSDSTLGVNETGQYFPLSQLQSKTDLPDSVNSKKLEVYLAESDFQVAFGMSKEQFYALPLWKQRQKKKDANLF